MSDRVVLYELFPLTKILHNIKMINCLCNNKHIHKRPRDHIAHVGHNSYQLLAAIGIKDNQYKDWNQKVQVAINLTHMVKDNTKFLIWQYYFTLIYS